MKLMIQPEAGIDAVVEELGRAEQSIHVAIFRCDHPAFEKALLAAVQRGVAVHTLIASTNRGGALRLRNLEKRLLAAGAVVARTNDDLPRYHGKYFVVDERELFVLGFNFTRSDIGASRSFGVSTTESSVVKRALELFKCDSTRQTFELEESRLLVSPVNARAGLKAFLEKAQKEVLIYDANVSDAEFLGVLRELAEKGVTVRVIGGMKKPAEGLEVRTPESMRLHTRTIVRDRKSFFIGSQSLRRLELDMRREVGLVVDDKDGASRIAAVFDADWETAQVVELPAAKLARRVAKAVAKDLGPIAELIQEAAEKTGASLEIDHESVEQLVKEAVKTAVRDSVQEAVLAHEASV